MSGDVKVPKRRFKEFQGTEGWEKHKLNDLLYLSGDKNNKGMYSQADILAASLGTELEKKSIFFGLRATKESVKNYKLVSHGDVIYTKSPIKGYPNGIIRTNKGVEGIVPSLYCVYHSISEINSSIIQAYFEDKNRLEKYLSPLVNIGARNNVNITDLDFLEGVINIPKSIKEQNDIVDVLDKLNSVLRKNQRKLEKLKALKKAYLTQMFPAKGESKPKLRFARFNDEWEEYKLGEVISDLKSGLSRMLSNNDIGLPVIRANNIDDGHLDLINDIKYWYINDPQGANINNYLIEKDDLLINFINSESKMGTAAIVTETPIRKTIYTTNILRLRTNEKCDNKFLLALTMTNNYKEYIKGISKIAVNQASFTTVDYKNYDMLIPSIIEQQKIGVLLDKIDKLILLHQRKLEKLQNLKKAYLNEMFI